jgi:hypothetical protein
MPTHTAQPTTAAQLNGDALRIECVTLSDSVRHELNRIKSVTHICTTVRKIRNSRQIRPASHRNNYPGGADFLFLRPIDPPLDPQDQCVERLKSVSAQTSFFCPRRPPESYLNSPRRWKYLLQHEIFQLPVQHPRVRRSIAHGDAPVRLRERQPPAASHIFSSKPRFNTCPPGSTARQSESSHTSSCPDS